MIVRSAMTGVALAAAPAFAEGDPRGFVSLTVENDIAGGTDQGYTNGLQLSLLQPANKRPFWAFLGLQRLPLFAADTPLRYETSLGQSMFTPQTIATRRPDPFDRPYAGFTYLTFGVTGLSDPRPSGRRRLDQLELTLGVIGPASLAGDTQRWWHKSFGFQRPNGWEQQLQNEPAINISYRRSFRFAPVPIGGTLMDFTPHFGFAVGNVYDYAGIGGAIRIGSNLPGIGLPRIQPAVPGTAFFDRYQRPQFYAFAGVDGRAVARNIFLDGNSFQSGPRVDRKTFVGDLDLGVVLLLHGVRLSYTQVFRSREFSAQRKPSSFGSLNVSIAY